MKAHEFLINPENVERVHRTYIKHLDTTKDGVGATKNVMKECGFDDYTEAETAIAIVLDPSGKRMPTFEH